MAELSICNDSIQANWSRRSLQTNVTVNSLFTLKASMTSYQNHNQPTAENLFLHYIFKSLDHCKFPEAGLLL